MKLETERYSDRFAGMVASLALMSRIVALVFAIGMLAGCASSPEPLSDTQHDPVAGEATPAPQAGPRGGWSW